MTYVDQIKNIPHFHIIRSAETQLIADYLKGTAGPYLDIGCGDGGFASTVGLSGVYGMDIDRSALSRLTLGATYTGAVYASASENPFKDSFFSTAFSNCAIEHMDGVDSVLKETARVLMPGGALVFTVPTPAFFRAIEQDEILSGLGLNTQGVIDEYNRFHRHVNILGLEVWTQKLEKAGFTIDSFLYYLPGEIGSFVARMDILYTIEGQLVKKELKRLEQEYKAILGGRHVRKTVKEYLKNPHIAKEGTHIIIKAVKR